MATEERGTRSTTADRTPDRGPVRVRMFVYNDFTHDSRVQKEATTLAEAGYEVEIVALKSAKTPWSERNGRIEVRRIALDPIHIRFLRWFRRAPPPEAPPGRPSTKGTPSGALVWTTLLAAAPAGRLADLPAARESGAWGTARAEVDSVGVRQAVRSRWRAGRKGVVTRVFLILLAVGAWRFFARGGRRVRNAVRRRASRISRATTRRIAIWRIRRQRALARREVLQRAKVRRREVAARRDVAEAVAIQPEVEFPVLPRLPIGRARRRLYLVLRRVLLRFHRPLSLLDFQLRIARLSAERPADIYHAHDLNTLLGAWMAARRTGGRLVYDSHEFFVERNTLEKQSRTAKSALSRLEAFLSRRCDGVITVNASIADELARRYGIPTPTVVMNAPRHVGADRRAPVGDLRATLGIGPERRILIYIGAITFNRGVEQAIDALVRLPDCDLVLLGMGKPEFKATIAARAAAAGLAARVHFHGPVPSHDVVAWAAQADLGIVPIQNACLSYYYCSPNKVFECLQAGIPVVASDFPELMKIIATHGVGRTFDPSDPTSIARVVREVLDDPAGLAEMKANTRGAASEFQWQTEEQRLLAVYFGIRPPLVDRLLKPDEDAFSVRLARGYDLAFEAQVGAIDGSPAAVLVKAESDDGRSLGTRRIVKLARPGWAHSVYAPPDGAVTVRVAREEQGEQALRVRAIPVPPTATPSVDPALTWDFYLRSPWLRPARTGDGRVRIPEALRQLKAEHLKAKKLHRAEAYEALLREWRGRQVLTHREYRSAAKKRAVENVVLVRHDVDHDMDEAVRMAEWEAARGFRTSYAILPTAWYYAFPAAGAWERTDDVVEACLRIQDLGHEIMLHNNAIAAAIRHGGTPLEHLRAELAFLRKNGLRVDASSSHGDPLCRKAGFLNLEVFRGMVDPKRGGSRVLTVEGKTIALGRVAPWRVGLRLETMEIPFTSFVSDSGGPLHPRDARPCPWVVRKGWEGGDVAGALLHPEWWDFRT